jgi:CRISPR-associated protein Csx17
VQAADDGTPAFRIARALAGLHGLKERPLPLRAQLFPVHPKFNEWMTPKAGYHVRFHTGQKGSLIDTLNALLARRLWLTEQFEMKDKPLNSPAGVMLDDIVTFLHDYSMDTRIAALLPGLCLCDIPQDTEHGAGEGVAQAAYSLLKLCLTPDGILRKQGWLGERDHLPVTPGMLSQLVADNHGNRAVTMAWRRLRASGVMPAFSSIKALPELSGVHPRRVAAALLVPLRFGATAALARSVLKAPETEAETA